MMAKTPVAARFLKRLVDVGDQICFSALRQWEFDKTLSSVASKHAQEFTPAVFSTNPLSLKIHRRMGDLQRFSEDAEQIALRMGVIASVEHVLACLNDMQTFRASVAPTSADSITHDAEEEQLRLKMEAWSDNRPVAVYFNTVGLLRLLRNHYVHLNEKPHPALKSYVSARGTSLNRFWEKAPTQLHGLDVRTLASPPLTFELAIAVVNLLRVSVLHIDGMLAKTLGTEDVVRWLLSEVLKHPRSKQLSVDRLISKVRYRLNMEFGHTCGEDLVRSRDAPTVNVTG